MVAARAHFNFVIDGTTALMRASAGGHTQVVRMLAAARANVDLGSCTDTALSRACSKGHVEIAAVLVEASASMRSKSEAVMLASERGHINKLLRNLVTARANMGFVKGWGSDGATAGLLRTSEGTLRLRGCYWQPARTLT